MGYADEDILKMKQQLDRQEEEAHEEDSVQNENEEQITDGMVHIYGEEVLFERKTVEEFGLSMILPADYNLVDEETKAVLYPLGNRPSHVFACGTVQGTVAMNYTPSAVPNEHIKDFLPKIQKLLEQMGPQSKMLKKEVIEKEEHNIGVLQFLSHAIDVNVYNFMTFISLEGKLLIITVSFPNKMSDRYVTLAEQMIDSIAFIEKED